MAISAGTLGLALVATGCSSSGSTDAGGSSSGASDQKITLTVATFNEFGYDDLLAEYM